MPSISLFIIYSILFCMNECDDFAKPYSVKRYMVLYFATENPEWCEMK